MFFLLLFFLRSGQAQVGASHEYIYDETGQLVRAFDSMGNVVNYLYDASGNLIEVRADAAGDIQILTFQPRRGPVGLSVRIQGLGFSPVPSENQVEFGSAVATVTAASPGELTVTVPTDAVDGPVTVTVAGESATSTEIFTVTREPTIDVLAPALAVSETVPSSLDGLVVTGTHLVGASFEVLPAFDPPALTVSLANIGPDGRTATLSLVIAADVAGSFVLRATTTAGRSSAVASPANSLRVLRGAEDEDDDGLNNADEVSAGTDPLARDSDGDAFIDGLEAAVGSDPLSAESTPIDRATVVLSVRNVFDPTPSAGLAASFNLSVRNVFDPARSAGLAAGSSLSVRNVYNTALDAGVSAGSSLAVRNIFDPTTSAGLAVGGVVSIHNIVDPTPTSGRVCGGELSVRNATHPASLIGEWTGPVVSVENLGNP